MDREQINQGIKVENIDLTLERFAENPILKPDAKHPWETKAVFNPAAVYEGGKVHILYRALGETDVSTLGYASSLDGLHIHERLDKPVYVPRETFEGVNPSYRYVSPPTGHLCLWRWGDGGLRRPAINQNR